VPRLFWFFLLGFTVASVFAQPPRIFYTDLESGPNKGGKDNAGAFVTISGKRFGPSAGASSFVTVGGGRVSSYPCWSDQDLHPIGHCRSHRANLCDHSCRRFEWHSVHRAAGADFLCGDYRKRLQFRQFYFSLAHPS
jgi:hypothetical protein